MANEETVGRQLASIIEMLPTDAQRLVNEHLPRLEALVDDEVVSYGQQMSDFLESRVGSVADAEKSRVEKALKELDDARPTDAERNDLADHAAKATLDLRRGLTKAEALAVRGEDRQTAEAVVSQLREAVGRFRQDVATGLRGTGVKTFIDRLDRWRDEPRGSIHLTDGELVELREAAELLPKMNDLVEVEQDRSGLATRAENAARDAGAIHERAREASDNAGDPDQPSPEPIAHTLRRIQPLLDGLSNVQRGDQTRSNDQLRTLARSVKQAALDLDREMGAQAIGIVAKFAEAWHKGQPVAKKEPDIEDARTACKKARDFYGVQDILEKALAACATDSGQLRNDLDRLAGDVGAFEALLKQHAEQRRETRLLEAGVDRLAQLAEQIAVRVNERAIASDAKSASVQYEAVRKELDALTDVVATAKAELDTAVTLIDAGKRFWQERNDGAKAMRRAVRDGVRAAKLPSSEG